MPLRGGAVGENDGFEEFSNDIESISTPDMSDYYTKEETDAVIESISGYHFVTTTTDNNVITDIGTDGETLVNAINNNKKITCTVNFPRNSNTNYQLPYELTGVAYSPNEGNENCLTLSGITHVKGMHADLVTLEIYIDEQNSIVTAQVNRHYAPIG